MGGGGAKFACGRAKYFLLRLSKLYFRYDFPIPIAGPTKRWMINSLRGKREIEVLGQVKIPKTHAMSREKDKQMHAVLF